MAKSTKIKQIEIPCTEFKQGKETLYVFQANAKFMWNYLKINQRLEDKDEGYQRTLSQSRVKAISKYIDAGNTLPQSLLISIDSAEVVKRSSQKYLIFPGKPDAGWVIDGQHRFAGANAAKTEIELAFIAFVGLDIQQQIQLFITINQEAKGVPTSLYLDLLKNLPLRSPQEFSKERSADIASQLKFDEQSPFYNRIVITTSPKSGELSLTNFVRKITPIILQGKGLLAVYTINEQRGIISNYYKSLQNVFPKEFNSKNSIFFQTLGFGALMNALPTFFSICFREYKGFTVEDSTKVFRKIEYFDFSDWHKKGTGSGAEIEAGNDLITELNTIFDIGDNKTIRI
jgi:DGQHR domain-containing protein